MIGPNYFRKLGIGPESDSQKAREMINSKIRELQALINSPDKNVRENAEKELKNLLKARKDLFDSIAKEAGIKETQKVYGEATYHYDFLDRLTKVIYHNDKELLYSYDPAGNRISLTYPNGEVATYKYNPNSWLIEVITKSGKTLFEYDEVGNLTKKILPSGITTTYTYNGAGKLIGLIMGDVNGHPLFSFSYTLDAVGNYLKLENSNNTTFFAYDPLYLLTKIKYPEGREVKYKYDSMGNRLSVKESPVLAKGKLKQWLTKPAVNLGILGNRIRYIYDSEGRLIKAGATEFRYNSNGNLIERNSGNGTTQYTYDADNKLITIEYPDGTYSKYTYDALGKRIGKTNRDGRTTYYLYDGYNLIQELDDKGCVIVGYIYGFCIDHPISMTRGGRTYYYLYDYLGSVIALSDENGKIVAEYEYDAWGNITKEVGYIENPFRFTGREWDKESGLYFFRARYYDPSLGRFISKNPSLGFLRNPQSLNRYLYAYNNPLIYLCPFGLLPAPVSSHFLPKVGNFREIPGGRADHFLSGESEGSVV